VSVVKHNLIGVNRIIFFDYIDYNRKKNFIYD